MTSGTTITRLSGTLSEPEGFRVGTTAGHSRHSYELRRVDAEPEDEDTTMVVECVSREEITDDGRKEREPEATDAVVELLADRNVEVQK